MKVFFAKKFLFTFFVLVVFGVGKSALASQNYFLDGTLIKGSGPEVFVLEDGLKRWIINPEIFSGLNYDWARILSVSDDKLAQYPTSRELKNSSRFPEGTLLKGTGSEVYLVEKGRRRWIPNPVTFDNLGLRWENIVRVSDQRLKKIGLGKDLPQQFFPKRYPETWFSESPTNIIDFNKATFRFNGRPGESATSLKFETFLEGVDKDWRQSSKPERTLTLDREGSPYLLFVRAVDDKESHDLTPAFHTFGLGISPYFGQVKISAGRFRETDPNQEYISIYNKGPEALDVTGWTVGTNYESKFYKLPLASQERQGRDYQVILPKGGRAYIISGYSPSGWSFRVNKCSGYLNNYSQYYPSLTHQCPVFYKDKLYLVDISSVCRQRLKKLSACQEIDNQEMLFFETSCKNFISENIGYQACLNQHQNDFDFFDDTWYLYLLQEKEIWREQSDEIILKDKSGLVVDRYRY